MKPGRNPIAAVVVVDSAAVVAAVAAETATGVLAAAAATATKTTRKIGIVAYTAALLQLCVPGPTYR